MQFPGPHSFLVSTLCLVSLVTFGAVVAPASVSTVWRAPASGSVSPGRHVVRFEDTDFLESLRADVARHPNDFVTFATETAGNHFLEDHWLDASRETEPRMVDRGVLGYWHGKTVVVLPVLSTRRGM